MVMPADLHIHTTFSDGTRSPEEIVELAQKSGLTTIAITDHDGVGGIEPAQKRGKELGVEIIPGIEFTTEAHDTEIHLLGYFIDCHRPKFVETITKIQSGREGRIFEMCKKLKGLGVDIDAQKVFAVAGHQAAGRPHVAQALVDQGHVANFKEAFNKYIDFHGPAYVPHYKLSPQEAVALIAYSGGVPVYGHPAVSNCDQIIPDLIKVGLRGIEVYYSSHSQRQTEHYLNLAKEYGLLVTGGSDYHGFASGRQINLGDISIPDELVELLKNEHLRRN